MDFTCHLLNFYTSICLSLFAVKQSGRDQIEEQGQKEELGSSTESYLDPSTGWDSMNDISLTFPLSRLKVTTNTTGEKRQNDGQEQGQGKVREGQGSIQGSGQGGNKRSVEERDFSSAISGITLELLTVLKALRKRFDCNFFVFRLFLIKIMIPHFSLYSLFSFYYIAFIISNLLYYFSSLS